MAKIVGGQCRAGVRRAGEQHQAALAVGLGGSQRLRVVDHRGREVARELDGGMELRLVAEGAAVEEGRGLEVSAVPRVIAPAYRTRSYGQKLVTV